VSRGGVGVSLEAVSRGGVGVSLEAVSRGGVGVSLEAERGEGCRGRGPTGRLLEYRVSLTKGTVPEARQGAVERARVLQGWVAGWVRLWGSVESGFQV
jgi:hypothetical protein